MEKYLIENVSSIESTLRGGCHGHSGLVIKLYECVTVVRRTFEEHTNPGDLPTFTPNSEGPAIVLITSMHKNESIRWN